MMLLLILACLFSSAIAYCLGRHDERERQDAYYAELDQKRIECFSELSDQREAYLRKTYNLPEHA